MVNKLNNLIARVELEKGELLLFMLWKNLPNDNTWSVIISADWIDRAGQSAALQYWISKIRGVLSSDELSQISRVGFLKPHDRITNLITSAIRVTNIPVRFSKNQIGDLYIEDAIIFRAKKDIRKRFLGANDRNPIYNHNINPIYNHNINPIYNQGFSGYYLYDNKLKQTGYLVYANEEIILLFNLDSNLQTIGAKNPIDGFTMHDDNQNWLGTLIPNEQGGFLFYSKDNNLIGYIN